MMNKPDKTYIAGHRGMVGSAILRKLQQEGYENIILRNQKHCPIGAKYLQNIEGWRLSGEEPI